MTIKVNKNKEPRNKTAKKCSMKYATPYNYVNGPHAGEYRKGESMTVPDEALSVQELYLNYSRGLPLPQTRQGTYSDEYFPDIRTLDLVDRQEIAEAADEVADKYMKETKKKEEHEKEQKYRAKFHVEQEEALKKTQQNKESTLEGTK